MNFDEKIAELTQLGTRAQATFAKRYISKIGPALCRTIIRYCFVRLNEINEALPDSDPGKIRHNDISNQQRKRIYTSGAGME